MSSHDETVPTASASSVVNVQVNVELDEKKCEHSSSESHHSKEEDELTLGERKMIAEAALAAAEAQDIATTAALAAAESKLNAASASVSAANAAVVDAAKTPETCDDDVANALLARALKQVDAARQVRDAAREADQKVEDEIAKKRSELSAIVQEEALRAENDRVIAFLVKRVIERVDGGCLTFTNMALAMAEAMTAVNLICKNSSGQAKKEFVVRALCHLVSMDKKTSDDEKLALKAMINTIVPTMIDVSIGMAKGGYKVLKKKGFFACCQ